MPTLAACSDPAAIVAHYGHTAELLCEGYRVTVRILAGRYVYGKTQWQVEPLAGSGQIWVNGERLLPGGTHA